MPVVTAAIEVLSAIGPGYSARATDDTGGQFSQLISSDLRRALRTNAGLFDSTRQMGVETLDDPDWPATATAIMLDLRGERQVTADVLIQEGFAIFSDMPCYRCDVAALGGQFRILAGYRALTQAVGVQVASSDGATCTRDYVSIFQVLRGTMVSSV